MYSTTLNKTKEKCFLNEIISKKLFKNKSIGKELSSIIISDVLGIDYETIYNNIEISSEEIAFSALTVNSTADVVLNDDEDKMIINIELNGYKGPIKENQVLSYVCQLFLGQIRKKEDYLNIKKVLQINIDTDDFLGFNDFMYNIFLMDNKHHQIASNEIEIIHFNLDYLRKLDYTIIKQNELMRILYCFICGVNDMDEFVEECDGDNFVKKIVQEVKKIAGQENVIPYLTEAEMRELEKEYYSNLYRKEGLEEGRKEGRKEGREEKRREMIISFYNNGVTLEIISKSTNLTIEEVEDIIKKGA